MDSKSKALKTSLLAIYKAMYFYGTNEKPEPGEVHSVILYAKNKREAAMIHRDLLEWLDTGEKETKLLCAFLGDKKGEITIDFLRNVNGEVILPKLSTLPLKVQPKVVELVREGMATNIPTYLGFGWISGAIGHALELPQGSTFWITDLGFYPRPQ